MKFFKFKNIYIHIFIIKFNETLNENILNVLKIFYIIKKYY